MRSRAYPLCAVLATSLALLSLCMPTPAFSDQLYIEPITSYPMVGGAFCDFAIDSQGFENVAFYTNSGVYYAKNTMSGWTQPELVGSGWNPSIALDIFDRPHIVFLSDPYLVKHGFKVDGNWVVETVGENARWNGMSLHLKPVIDSQCNPHVAYVVQQGGVLYASKRSGGWTTEVVDGPPITDATCDLALDSLDQPHILYTYGSGYPGSSYLRYASKVGSTWQIEDMTQGNYFYACSLALDGNDLPYVSFGSDLVGEFLTYGHRTGEGFWIFENVDPGMNLGGLLTDIAVTPEGAPYISSCEWSTTSVRYAIRTEEGWQNQLVDGSASDPRILIDRQGRPRMIWDRFVGGGLAYPALAHEPQSVEVIGATSDSTLYQNGVSVAHIQVKTRRFFAPSGPVSLSIDLVPSIGPRMHVGDDAFTLNVGEEHISSFDWAVPDSSYSWEFDLDAGVEDHASSVLISNHWLNRAIFAAARLSSAIYHQYFGLVQHCQLLDPETECLYSEVSMLPIIGDFSDLTLMFQNMCKSQWFWANGDRSRGDAALIAGFSSPLKISLKAALQEQSVPEPIIDSGGLWLKYGEALRTCEAVSIGGGSSAGLFSEVRGYTSSTFVDSMAVWMAVGIDSVQTDLADALLSGGNCRVLVEADGSWTDADSLGLVYADVLPISDVGSVTTVTKHIFSVPGSEANNPHSACTFRIWSNANQPFDLGLLHYNAGGHRFNFRYPEFNVTTATKMALSVQDDATEFPLLVDLDGDGSVDATYYPITSAVPEDQSGGGLRTALSRARPNPFNPTTTIKFSIASRGRTQLLVYDASGRLVAQPLDAVLDAGDHTFVWDGRTDSRKQLGSGVYFCRLRFGATALSERLVLLK